MIIALHILQSYGPANLNRGMDGAPKDTTFGQVPRGRISSQCLKHLIRTSPRFARAVGTAIRAKRTRAFPAEVAAYLTAHAARLDLDPEGIALIANRAVELGRESAKTTAKGEGAEGEGAEGEGAEGEGAEGEGAPPAPLATKSAIFYSDEELAAIAEGFAEVFAAFGAKKFGEVKMGVITGRLFRQRRPPRSIDTALFGRMSTSAALDEYDSAVQVAHAITTHRVDTEFDYYTAVDDMIGQAAFIGETPFNASTYYKLLNVDVRQLIENVAGDVGAATAALVGFVETACLEHPTGHQTQFAHHAPPDLILIEARPDDARNYVNAFQRPVRANGHGLTEASAAALGSYIGRLDTVYGPGCQRRFVSTIADLDIPAAERLGSLADLLTWLREVK